MYGSRLTSPLLLASTVAFTLGTVLPSEAQQSPRPRLTLDQCQPLTAENYELCCIARNRHAILTAEQLEQCPPLVTSLIQNVINNRGFGFSTSEDDDRRNLSRSSPRVGGPSGGNDSDSGNDSNHGNDSNGDNGGSHGGGGWSSGASASASANASAHAGGGASASASAAAGASAGGVSVSVGVGQP